MYTQCTHCAAVFRVNMKELTVAQGKLRCGECDGVFNAMDTLSTTLPKKQEAKHEESPLVEYGVPDTQHHIPTKERRFSAFQVLAALTLISLLVAQVLYSNKSWFTNELKRSPEQVHMISRNVISHPNDSGVLLISASIENKAEHAQPYPFVEVTLLDGKENVIALRRFKPEEYLQHYSENGVLESHKETMLQLKIADPGKKATRFNFKFL